MNGGDGASGNYASEMRQNAQEWLAGLHQELENLVERVPPDVDRVAEVFAEKLRLILKHIAVLEYFLAEGTDSAVTARAQALVENTLGN